jgi:putative DNA primase/helicase
VAGPAILAWAVRGCLIWQKEGLIVPDIIETATEEYRQSQDPMAEFYEEECIFEPDVFVPVADLRDAYDKWAEDAGIPEKYRLGRKACNERLQDKGCERKSTRYTNNVGTEKVGKCWHGVMLKSACNRFERKKPEEIQDEIPF